MAEGSPRDTAVAGGGERNRGTACSRGREPAESGHLTRETKLHDRLSTVAPGHDILDAPTAQGIEGRASLASHIKHFAGRELPRMDGQSRHSARLPQRTWRKADPMQAASRAIVDRADVHGWGLFRNKWRSLGWVRVHAPGSQRRH